MEEIIDDVPNNRILFKILKFFLGRRKKGISYKELYLIYINVYNLKRYDEHAVKEEATKAILEIYYYNNGKYPL